MNGSWKEHPDPVYSVAQEAAEAWVTVEQADKLCRVRPVRKVLSREWAVPRSS